jgi:uncharacterized protein with HEPN domain
MSRRNDLVYLWDMRQYAERASDYARDKTFDDYRADTMLRDAVERVVMNIGEAANKVSKAYREQHANIPWLQIIAQRHRLVHDYGSIDHERIWEVATIHAPALIRQLDAMLPEPPQDPEPED